MKYMTVRVCSLTLPRAVLVHVIYIVMTVSASLSVVAVTLNGPQSQSRFSGHSPASRVGEHQTIFITHKTIINVNDIFAINHSDQQPRAERTWRRSAGSGSTERFFSFSAPGKADMADLLIPGISSD